MQTDATDLALQVQKVAMDIVLGMGTYLEAPKGGMVRSALMGSLVSRMRSLDFAFATLDRQHCKDVAEDCRTVRLVCPNTGLRCLPGCDHKNCLGLTVPLNEWPDVDQELWPDADTVLR